MRKKLRRLILTCVALAAGLLALQAAPAQADFGPCRDINPFCSTTCACTGGCSAECDSEECGAGEMEVWCEDT